MKFLQKIIIFSAFIISIFQHTFAQNMQHSSLWTKVDLQAKLSEKNAVSLEMMYRTQSNFNNNSRNPFSETLNFSMRLWYNFQYNKQVAFLVSPFSYWKSYPLIRQKSDIGKQFSNEFRFAIGTELKQNLHPKIDFTQRFLVEHRLVETTTHATFANFNRFRTKLALRFSLLPKLSLMAADELIIQFGQHILPSNYFDQNRIILGVSYKISNRLKFDFGLMPIAQKRKDVDIFDEINTTYINLNYLLFDKKKESKF